MVVVLCGVWINSAGWVVSLDYRKPVCRCRRRWVLWLGSCTILFDDVTYSLCTCLVSVYRRIQSRYVKVGDSELVLSVLKFRVHCGMPVASRVEVSLLLCFIKCKWPCPFVRVLGNVYSRGEGVGQL